MDKLIIFGLVIITCLSCVKENESDSTFIDTFDLITDDCYSSIEHSSICFDSVLSDSRCPIGANCKWEGNATIVINLTTRDNNYKVRLNTNSGFPIDTIIENIYILLNDLSPYPDISMVINPKEYKAKLTIANIDKLESNAKIIDFNPDKCGCCWGWTIKIGNDTIKSGDELIGKLIGYKINYPINVYIELDDLEQTCSEFRGYDYYGLKHMIKIN